MDAIERINQLREELNRHNYNYYVLHAPEISDRDFDFMLKAPRNSRAGIRRATTLSPPRSVWDRTCQKDLSMWCMPGR